MWHKYGKHRKHRVSVVTALCQADWALGKKLGLAPKKKPLQQGPIKLAD